jgi:hypothetical protein
MQNFWKWLFIFCTNRIKGGRGLGPGNLVRENFKYKELSISIEYLKGEQIYSREELVSMMHEIRKAEKIIGWKVPELRLSTKEE